MVETIGRPSGTAATPSAIEVSSRRSGERPSNPEADHNACSEALSALAGVHVGPNDATRFPAPFTPADYLTVLKQELAQIRDVAAFRAALKELLDKTERPTVKQLKGLPIPSVDWYFRPTFIEYLQIRRALETLGMTFEALPKGGGLGYMPDNVLCEW